MSYPKSTLQPNVFIIINPDAGRKLAVVPAIQKFIQNNKLNWNVAVSKSKEGIAALVQEAKRAKANIIAIYGGDGTMQAAAKPLMETALPLCILPGGSGNVLSKSLHLPQVLKKNLEMLASGRYQLRAIDVGQVNSMYFLIRVSFGFEAKLVEKAHRSLKEKLGMLAYAASSFNALVQAKASRYDIELDGYRVAIDGVACTIANSGNLGVPGISISPDIKVDDGLFDVLVIPKIKSERLTKIMLKIADKSGREEIFKHWQAKRVSIKANPSQVIHCDGDIVAMEKLSARILPKALWIVVPQD